MSDQDGWTKPIVSLLGESIALGPLRHDLIPFYQRWDNDVTLLVLEEGYATPNSREGVER